VSNCYSRFLHGYAPCPYRVDCPIYDPNGECNTPHHVRCGKYKDRMFGPVKTLVKVTVPSNSTLEAKNSEGKPMSLKSAIKTFKELDDEDLTFWAVWSKNRNKANWDKLEKFENAKWVSLAELVQQIENRISWLKIQGDGGTPPYAELRIEELQNILKSVVDEKRPET
jgi:hypothetical protein